jgi:hypothetical protein
VAQVRLEARGGSCTPGESGALALKERGAGAIVESGATESRESDAGALVKNGAGAQRKVVQVARGSGACLLGKSGAGGALGEKRAGFTQKIDFLSIMVLQRESLENFTMKEMSKILPEVHRKEQDKGALRGKWC